MRRFFDFELGSEMLKLDCAVDRFLNDQNRYSNTTEGGVKPQHSKTLECGGLTPPSI
ncbi:MAG: hypothetical protein JWM11_4253 [Planctomycetaceae bacterium]|nr:hypothetical protein [Planctomycetaceae bacterium]